MAHLSLVPWQEGVIMGIGEPWLRKLGTHLDGFRSFPGMTSPLGVIPSTQGDLWMFVGGRDQGKVLLTARSMLARLGPAFVAVEEVPSFRYADGRDLSGYEDGTENPTGERAVDVALVPGDEPGLAGSSFVAVQRWVHDLTLLERLPAVEQDHIIGRHRTLNHEIEDAPASAHVKRSAQESYLPEAFMVRQSMPWGTPSQHGLYFVAYGRSLDAFERVLTRMAGIEDGMRDALFTFTHPVTGGYYWCPPVLEGRLNLRAIHLGQVR